MALVPDQKFSTFQNGGDIQDGDLVVGLRGGLNTRFTYNTLPPSYIIPISQGGTGATNAPDARFNLGLGSMALQDASAVAITGGTAALTTGQIATLPANPTDITNKAYVDATAAGRYYVAPCAAATLANFASTYDNAASGVGATLTATSNGAAVIDDVPLVLTSRVLFIFQTNDIENGVYVVTQVGDGSNPAIFTRALDYDVPSDIDIGDTIFITGGTQNTGAGYLQTDEVNTIGTDPINFTLFVNPNVVTLAGTQTITGLKNFTKDLNYPNKVTNNIIIGGDFSLNPWQRGTTLASAPNNSYLADRFRYNKVGAGVVTYTRSTAFPSVAQANYFTGNSLAIVVTTADVAIAATDYYYVTQPIEGYNFSQIAQRPFTVSFWVRSTLTGTYCLTLSNGVDRNYISEYTINAVNVWQKIEITVPGSPSAGTWNYQSGTGLFVTFSLATGTNFQGSVNTWQAGNLFATANQVNFMASATNVFYLALVQVESGEVATPFEQRTRQKELNLCQRYYIKSFNQDTAPANGIPQGSVNYTVERSGVTFDRLRIFFPVSLRNVVYTTQTYNTNAATSTWHNASLGITSGAALIEGASQDGMLIRNQQLATDTASNLMSIQYTADAEIY